MKQTILQFGLLLCCLSAFGQDVLNFRMCDVYRGKVKSIVVTSPEMMKSEAEFSTDGKIMSMKNSMLQIDYEWNGNDEVKLLGNNSYGSETVYIYINEYKDDFYDYDMGETNMKVWFRENGSLYKKVMTQNGNTMTCTYHYQKDSDLYPYKIENRMGTQSQVIYVNVEKCDAKGNAIIFSQTSNGVTIQQKRKISYYE